jgi:acyl-CoA thioester hydrolase
MNVASYVAKFDEATWQLFLAIGLTPSRLRGGGIGMAGVDSTSSTSGSSSPATS